MQNLAEAPPVAKILKITMKSIKWIRLPCQGLKCKRTSRFQKAGWDFSQLCLPKHLSWNDLHVVKNHVLVQILPSQ